jgi:hypothetical protein
MTTPLVILSVVCGRCWTDHATLAAYHAHVCPQEPK